MGKSGKTIHPVSYLAQETLKMNVAITLRERERGWEKAVEEERERRERGEVRARGRHKHTGKRARRVPSRILRREGPS